MNPGSGNQATIYALPTIPNEITYGIQRKLDLPDVNAFIATSHAALSLREIIWFDWAKKFGYYGNLKGSQKYLSIFFHQIAEAAQLGVIPKSWKVLKNVKFSKGQSTKKIVDGYLTAINVLSAHRAELQNLAKNERVYQYQPLIWLVERALGADFKQVVNKDALMNFCLIPTSRNGNTEQIRKICQLITPNSEGQKLAPIHAASESGQGAAIRILCQYGADPNAIWHWTTVHRSTSGGPGNRRTHSHTTHHYATPLELAYESGSEDAVTALLEAKANPGKVFLRTCQNANYTMLKIFLELAPSCDVNKGLGEIFNSYSYIRNPLPCAELFLKYGANPDLVDWTGKSLLHHFVRKANIDMLRLLRQYGADIECRTRKGKTPLYVAIKDPISGAKRAEVVRVLCELGANINALGPKGKKTMLEHAKKKPKIYNLLLQIAYERDSKTIGYPNF